MTKRYHTCEEIASAHFCLKPPGFANRQGTRRGAKATGIRYERKVQALFSGNDWYLPGPWILYVTGGSPYWCQPDGIHFDVNAGVLTIIEVKLKHTDDARLQLRGVYEPVLRRMFPDTLWTFRLVEVVKWYDPDITFREPHVMCADPFKHSSPQIGVHVCRPD